MRKAQFLALIFASGMILSSCAGGGSKTEAVWPSAEESSNSMTISDTNNQSSAFSSTENSQKDSSSLSSLQSTAEGYKKVFFSITSSTQNEYSMSSEIPENLEISDNGTIDIVMDSYDIGSYSFLIEDDKSYPDDYFEQIKNSTSPLAFKKLGGPRENDYVFSLADGAPVYSTSDAGMGHRYFKYQFIKESKLLTFSGSYSAPEVYGLNNEDFPLKEENIQHILSSLEFIEE